MLQPGTVLRALERRKATMITEYLGVGLMTNSAQSLIDYLLRAGNELARAHAYVFNICT